MEDYLSRQIKGLGGLKTSNDFVESPWYSLAYNPAASKNIAVANSIGQTYSPEEAASILQQQYIADPNAFKANALDTRADIGTALKGPDGTGMLGGLAGLAGDTSSILGLVSGLDNLFGSGRDLRKASLANLKQSLDQNKEAMRNIREDRADFRRNRKAITDSYNS